MTMVPSDVLAFLAELESVSTALINKYYEASEAASMGEGGMYTNKAFHHVAPVTVEVRTQDGLLARFMEEGIVLYPEETTGG